MVIVTWLVAVGLPSCGVPVAVTTAVPTMSLLACQHVVPAG
jgi:hypothetical protein